MARPKGKESFKEKVQRAEMAGKAKISVDVTLTMLREMEQYVGRDGLHIGPSDFVRSAIRNYLDALGDREFRQREVSVGEKK
jgi:Arc/MetJ-type ribon-helix-helix transcriptional regulator